MAAEDIHRTIETVFRMERAKLIASLARMVRDVGQITSSLLLEQYRFRLIDADTAV